MKQFYDNMKHKTIIIFGTGNAARIITEKIKLNVQYYVDNDSTKFNNYFMGKPINSPQILFQEHSTNVCIIVASMYYAEIASQLQQMGFREEYDFFSGLDMFINPLNHDKEKAAIYEIKHISNKLDKIIARGDLKDAEKLLSEYKKLVPFDERVNYFKGLIALEQQNLEKLKKYITKGIKDSRCNINLNYYFNLARRQEENKQHLSAIETYEKLLLENNSDKVKNKVINSINKIEEQHKNDIYKQLSELNNCSKNYIIKEESYNVHLMFDHFHIKKFLEFINKYNQDKNNIFLIFRRNDEKEFLKENLNPNVHIIEIKNDNNEEIVGLVKKYLDHADKVFIHYLHDFICWLICRCNIIRNLHWIIWGGDLYSYLYIDLYDELTKKYLIKTNIQYIKGNQDSLDCKIRSIFRKSAIRRLTYILTWNEGDYNLACKNFITTAKYKYFSYPNPVDFTLLDSARNKFSSKYNLKDKYKYVFLLGNSADPSNNHLEALSYLKEYKNEDFCVIIPLSYGGDEMYTKELVIESKKLLGDKIILLTEFLTPEEYAEILNQVDVSIMNHNRQQGAGNILALLYLGKKVYTKHEVTTFEAFSRLGIRIYDIKDLKNSSFKEIIESDKNIQGCNSVEIHRFFNEKRLKENFDRLFK